VFQQLLKSDYRVRPLKDIQLIIVKASYYKHVMLVTICRSPSISAQGFFLKKHLYFVTNILVANYYCLDGPVFDSL